MRAIRESANKFLHHKIGTNDYSEDVEDKEDKEEKPTRKGPAVDTVDSNMGASGKDKITGNFRGKDRNKQEDEIEKVEVSKSKGKKPKKEKGEQDDNAKEDDDKVDEPGSKSKTKTDANEEQGKICYILV